MTVDGLYLLENCYDRHAWQSPDGRRKVQLFAALVPASCRSVLDVGGGTGWVTIGMRKKGCVVTLDSSPASLGHAPDPRVLGDVASLPFADRSFDLVMSSQVLEHLSDRVFDRARIEMGRVARKCLLVSVPYREDLGRRFVRCGACGAEFHRDHHLRSFAEHDLPCLFEGWLLAEWHVFGALCEGVGINMPPVSSPSAGGRDIPFASELTVCPACGKQGGGPSPLSQARRRSFLKRVVSFSRRRLAAILPAPVAYRHAGFLPQSVVPYWIAALYLRKGSASAVDGDVSEFVRDGRDP